ncbi:MAG: serine hydrolase domain-containing protein, partial [Bacteroidota bacterium]
LAIVCLGGLLLACGKGPQDSTDHSQDPIATAIQALAKALLADPKIQSLSVGVWVNQTAYTQHFGELDPGKVNPPHDATLYEIASVSKSFTGTLVAQAVLDQKLDLEADIRQYLAGDYPNLEYQGSSIRVRHLVTHTAGLPRFFPDRINALFDHIDENLPFRIYEIEKEYTQDQFLAELATITIQIEPGTQYRYSNADVELVAHLLENVYQQPFEDILRTYITAKAGMPDTQVHLSAEQNSRLANGYGEAINPVPHFANTLWGAGGGIKSTTADLIKYMQFQLDDSIPAVRESQRLLYTEEGLQSAYLWPVLDSPEDGVHYAIHGGAFGTQNYLLILPKYQLGISIITNQSGPTTQGKLLDTLNALLEDIKPHL